MSLYEIAILGAPTASERAALVATLAATLAEFELEFGRDVALRDASAIPDRDRHAAAAAVFFAAPGAADADVAAGVMAEGVPVIPTIPANGDFAAVPAGLRSANGLRRRTDDPNLEELAAALLECIGLLRRQRRVFISYRRIESRTAALQLHDLLGGRGFEVFLDTHDIRPGETFQDVLWHRLCDSDVLVMLDTPTYFESKWTRQEFGRARAKGIHVLRVVWPDHTPTRHTDLAETLYLEPAELSGSDGPLVDATADAVALAVERLRSRSLAARHLSLAGRLRAEVEGIGGTVEGIGAHRALSLRLPDDRQIWAYPVIGVPTAELLNDVAEKARRAEQDQRPALVYDAMGIRAQWAEHLAWLQTHISAVRWVKVAEAGWTLAALDD